MSVTCHLHEVVLIGPAGSVNHWSDNDARAVMRSGICKLGHGKIFSLPFMGLLHLCICCKNIVFVLCEPYEVII